MREGCGLRVVPERKTRIAIIEDHPVYLKGLVDGIDKVPEMTVSSWALGYQDGRSLISAGRFDILVTEILLPRREHGLDLIRTALRKQEGCRVVVLSFSREVNDIYLANQAGAHCYLLKNLPLQSIVRSLKEVDEGGYPPLEPELQHDLWRRIQQQSQAPSSGRPFGLNEREWQVLGMLVQGHTNKEIADRLCIGDRAVRRANTSLFSSLSVRNRAEAAAFAVRKRLFD